MNIIDFAKAYLRRVSPQEQKSVKAEDSFRAALNWHQEAVSYFESTRDESGNMTFQALGDEGVLNLLLDSVVPSSKMIDELGYQECQSPCLTLQHAQVLVLTAALRHLVSQKLNEHNPCILINRDTDLPSLADLQRECSDLKQRLLDKIQQEALASVDYHDESVEPLEKLKGLLNVWLTENQQRCAKFFDHWRTVQRLQSQSTLVAADYAVHQQVGQYDFAQATFTHEQALISAWNTFVDAFGFSRMAGETIENANIEIAYSTVSESRAVIRTLQSLILSHLQKADPSQESVPLREEKGSCQQIGYFLSLGSNPESFFQLQNAAATVHQFKPELTMQKAEAVTAVSELLTHLTTHKNQLPQLRHFLTETQDSSINVSLLAVIAGDFATLRGKSEYGKCKDFLVELITAVCNKDTPQLNLRLIEYLERFTSEQKALVNKLVAYAEWIKVQDTTVSPADDKAETTTVDSSARREFITLFLATWDKLKLLAQYRNASQGEAGLESLSFALRLDKELQRLVIKEELSEEEDTIAASYFVGLLEQMTELEKQATELDKIADLFAEQFYDEFYQDYGTISAFKELLEKSQGIVVVDNDVDVAADASEACVLGGEEARVRAQVVAGQPNGEAEVAESGVFAKEAAGNDEVTLEAVMENEVDWSAEWDYVLQAPGLAEQLVLLMRYLRDPELTERVVFREQSLDWNAEEDEAPVVVSSEQFEVVKALIATRFDFSGEDGLDVGVVIARLDFSSLTEVEQEALVTFCYSTGEVFALRAGLVAATATDESYRGTDGTEMGPMLSPHTPARGRDGSSGGAHVTRSPSLAEELEAMTASEVAEEGAPEPVDGEVDFSVVPLSAMSERAPGALSFSSEPTGEPPVTHHQHGTQDSIQALSVKQRELIRACRQGIREYLAFTAQITSHDDTPKRKGFFKHGYKGWWRACLIDALLSKLEAAGGPGAKPAAHDTDGVMPQILTKAQTKVGRQIDQSLVDTGAISNEEAIKLIYLLVMYSGNHEHSLSCFIVNSLGDNASYTRSCGFFENSRRKSTLLDDINTCLGDQHKVEDSDALAQKYHQVAAAAA